MWPNCRSNSICISIRSDTKRLDFFKFVTSDPHRRRTDNSALRHIMIYYNIRHCWSRRYFIIRLYIWSPSWHNFVVIITMIIIIIIIIMQVWYAQQISGATRSVALAAAARTSCGHVQWVIIMAEHTVQPQREPSIGTYISYNKICSTSTFFIFICLFFFYVFYTSQRDRINLRDEIDLCCA